MNQEREPSLGRVPVFHLAACSAAKWGQSTFLTLLSHSDLDGAEQYLREAEENGKANRYDEEARSEVISGLLEIYRKRGQADKIIEYEQKLAEI